MKLTVLDLQTDPVFETEDFHPGLEDFEFTHVRVLANENFDGSLISQVPVNTTHLVMTTPDRIGGNELEKLPLLEYIGLSFTGFWDKVFDQQLLKARKITVTNCPDYAQAGVAEGVFAALLAHFRKLHNLDLKNPYSPAPIGRELSNKTLGIIGLGKIGKHVADIAAAFGMKVVSYSKTRRGNVKHVERSELLKISDVISIHVPKSAGEMIKPADFKELKPDVTLINTSGKEKYNLDGLKAFLVNNVDSAYVFLALPESDHVEALNELPNAILYPLFTCYTEEGEKKRKTTTLENLLKYVDGVQLQNRVL